MAKGLVKAGDLLCAGLAVAVLAGQMCPRRAAAAGFSMLHHHKASDDATTKKGSTASQPPAFSIPVEPLGFYSPGPYYEGQRESLVSLDFLSEDKLS